MCNCVFFNWNILLQQLTGLVPPQMMGLILPWFGPLVGLFVISPLIEMGLAESRQLTADSQCFKNAVNVCDSSSTFEYYFWNITNPDEVRRADVAHTVTLPSLTSTGADYAIEGCKCQHNILIAMTRRTIQDRIQVVCCASAAVYGGHGASGPQ